MKDGVNGLLSPFGDAPALAEKMQYLIDHPDREASIAREARRRAQDFSPQAYVRRFEDALRAAIPSASPLSAALTVPA
jgi:glycosyltransferase involved in cell wall biosynthesis